LGVLKDGFHDRLLIFLLRPFFQILAPFATLIEIGARSQLRVLSFELIGTYTGKVSQIFSRRGLLEWSLQTEGKQRLKL
jgi:hypothetical protein